VDALAERAHTELPEELKPHPDCLHFHEQHVAVIINGKKKMSKLSLHIADNIHGPALEGYLMEKEGWTQHTCENILWMSFQIAFNKLVSDQ
jgi:hypothetical protein